MSSSKPELQIGKRFGNLTIVGLGIKHDDRRQSKRLYECKCDCGNIEHISIHDLKRGHVKMCKECRSKNGEFIYFGGIKKHPLYRRARGVFERCNFKHNPEYYNYGGRGIKCELGDSVSEVIKSLEQVPGYFEDSQIDRIDNNGNYTLYHPEHGYDVWYDENGRPCKGNLRWATTEINSLNKRTTVNLEDLKNFPRRTEKIREVLARNGLEIDDVILIKSNVHSKIGRPKYYVAFTNEDVVNIRNKYEPEADPKLDFRKYRVIPETNTIVDERFYSIASNILAKCNKPHTQNYRLFGGKGIKCLIGDTVREVINSIEKVPGYEAGLFIDRTEPYADFSLTHPKHGDKIWTDEQGYKCLGTLRWVKHSDLQVRKIVSDERKISLEDLSRYPRPIGNLNATIKRNYKQSEFIYIPVDNSNVSARNETLYKAYHKSLLKDINILDLI